MAIIECASVEIIESRWNTTIILRDADGGDIAEYVASADSYLTDGSGIWFGTRAEYDQRCE